VKPQNRIRNKAREVALSAYINPKDEFLDKVEEELEKTITQDFLEKIRTDFVKKQKRPD